MSFQKIGNVIQDRAKPVSPPAWKVAAENDEYAARCERRLAELANKPQCDEHGQVIYHCRACKDMQWLRADVPFNHPLFGKVRLCLCSPQFATYGARWFAPSELYHLG